MYGRPVADATKTESSAAVVVTEYFDAIANRDLDAMAAVWAEDGVDHLYGLADMVGPEGVRAYFAELFGAFPDLKLEVTDMITEGDRSCVRWHATGTFDGDGKFQGLDPNGATIELEGMDLLTVRDGLVVDNRAYTDASEIARQLGALPPKDSAPEKAMVGALNLKTKALTAIRNRQG